MATLTGSTIAGSYKDLLKIAESSKQAGLDATLRAVEDGDATASALYLATDSALISGNGTKLYFYDADGGEHISADNAGNLTIAAGAATDDLITLDSTGYIALNADGDGTVIFEDASLQYGIIENSSSDFVIRAGVQDKDLVFKGNDGGVGITAMTIDMSAGGNVGIGTAAPSGTLDIEVTNDNARIHLNSVTSGDSGIDFEESGTRKWLVMNEKSSASELQFKTNSATVMTLLQGGNVGIGTASPETKLHVVGTVDDPLTSGSTSYGTLTVQTNGASLHMGSYEASPWEFYLQAANDADLSSYHDLLLNPLGGNVGIGTATPSAHLEVMDETIDTTATYVGIYASHVKTAGDTNASDDYTGVYSSMQFNDADADFGTLWGIRNFVESSAASSDESTEILGIYSRAKMDGNTDVNNIYGTHIVTDVDSGTVDSAAYGILIDVDVEPAVPHSTGLHINHDNASEATGGEPHGRGIDIRSNTNIDMHLVAYDGVGDTWAIHMSRAGIITSEGAHVTAGLDYAEYFESKDGSSIAIGKTVKLDNDKIVACEEGDTPIGVVRPVDGSATIGGGQVFHWQSKFMKDDYSATVWEDYTLKQWDVEITFDEYIARGKDESGGSIGGMVKDEKVEGSKAIPAKEAVTQQKTVDEEVEEEVTTTEVVLEDGKYVQKTTTETVTKTVKVPQYDEEDLYDEDGEVIGKHQVPIMETVKEAVSGVDAVPDTYFREHKYHSDRIPDGLTVPDDAKTVTPGNQRQKLNPDFDPSKSEAYKSREERDEWHIVGLLGQIPITKGQPTGNWIKMKDVSDTVEMYFVK